MVYIEICQPIGFSKPNFHYPFISFYSEYQPSILSEQRTTIEFHKVVLFTLLGLLTVSNVVAAFGGENAPIFHFSFKSKFLTGTFKPGALVL